MPIRIQGTTNSRLGRVTGALGSLTTSFRGTRGLPAGRDGRILTSLGATFVRFLGQSSVPANRNGRIGATLAGFSPLLRGTFTPAGVRNGKVVPVLGVLRTLLRGTVTTPITWQNVPTVTFVKDAGEQFYYAQPLVVPATVAITKNALAFHDAVITYDAVNERYRYSGSGGALGGSNGHVLIADDGGVVNQPPNWAASVNQSLTVGVPFTLDLDSLCSDPESAQLTYTVLTGVLANIGLTQSGTRGNIISGTPTSTTGSPLTVTVRAAD